MVEPTPTPLPLPPPPTDWPAHCQPSSAAGQRVLGAWWGLGFGHGALLRALRCPGERGRHAAPPPLAQMTELPASVHSARSTRLFTPRHPNGFMNVTSQNCSSF